MNTLYGIKINHSQRFTSSGKRIPVTMVKIDNNTIVQTKTPEKDGYTAVQVVVGKIKNIKNPIAGHLKKHLGTEKIDSPRYLREIRLVSVENHKSGDVIKPTEVLKAGDLVNITAKSKGKGFAGVVKRHNFRGGPKTHGQSNRHRAPGSIGQTTTPGRVYRGKRMAGHMGAESITQRNLTVMSITDKEIIIKGTTPGPQGSLTKITKVGETKHFQPLLDKQGLDKDAIAQEQAQAQVIEEETTENSDKSE